MDGHGGWGSGCSDYLHISCREALISLPRSHSTGLGLSHLQCKAERMGKGERGGKGEQGRGGRVGKHCINARSRSLTRLVSHELKYREPQRHTRTPRIDYESWQHRRRERRSGPRRSPRLLLCFVLQLLNRKDRGGSCWKAKPLSELVYYVCNVNHTSKIEGFHLLE